MYTLSTSISALPFADAFEKAFIKLWNRWLFPCEISPNRVRYSVISCKGTFAAIKTFAACAVCSISNGVQKLNSCNSANNPAPACMSPSIMPKSSLAALNDVLASNAAVAKFPTHLSKVTAAVTAAREPISFFKSCTEKLPDSPNSFNSAAARLDSVWTCSIALATSALFVVRFFI